MMHQNLPHITTFSIHIFTLHFIFCLSHACCCLNEEKIKLINLRRVCPIHVYCNFFTAHQQRKIVRTPYFFWAGDAISPCHRHRRCYHNVRTCMRFFDSLRFFNIPLFHLHTCSITFNLLIFISSKQVAHEIQAELCDEYSFSTDQLAEVAGISCTLVICKVNK